MLFGYRNRTVLTAVLGSLLAFSAAATQSSVTLNWSPSSSSGVSAYHLYYGTVSRSYSNMVSLATVTSATVSNLNRGVTYYFAVTAFDNTTGLESPYSNEASYTAGSGVGGSTPTLQLTLTQGQPVLNCSGLPGTNYNVLASSNLINWSVIGAVVAGTNGGFQFTDTSGSSKRLYVYKLEQH
jgi:Fibronectin type III domain